MQQIVSSSASPMPVAAGIPITWHVTPLTVAEYMYEPNVAPPPFAPLHVPSAGMTSVGPAVHAPSLKYVTVPFVQLASTEQPHVPAQPNEAPDPTTP
jgi:hypothetical protein